MARPLFSFDRQVYKNIIKLSNNSLRELSSTPGFFEHIEDTLKKLQVDVSDFNTKIASFNIGTVQFIVSRWNDAKYSIEIRFYDDFISYKNQVFYVNDVSCITVTLDLKKKLLFDPHSSSPSTGNALSVYEAIQALTSYVRQALSD